MSNEELAREELKRRDEARFAGRLARASRTRVHGVIPNHFFSAASSECRDAFIEGHYYACISLAQAVAEGLARFLDDFHPVGAKKNPEQRVRRLHNKGHISSKTLAAFLAIWGNDRHAFHHLNKDVPTNHAELERRAEQCVNALLVIESELFAFEIANGKLVPKHLAYWSKSAPEQVQVFLRLSGP